MENILWTVSIIYQISDAEDNLFFNFLKQDIENQYSTSPQTVKYFVLRQDEKKNEGICLTINSCGRLEEVVKVYPLKGMYADPRIASSIWSDFLSNAGKLVGCSHFILTHGHAAGLGFFSRPVLLPKAPPLHFGPDKIAINLQIALSHFIVNNVSLKKAREDLFKFINKNSDKKSQFFIDVREEENMGIIPVSALKIAVEKAFVDKITFLYFGNCFMQTIENGYLFKDKVKYIAGTEAFYIITGTDFLDLFRLLSMGNKPEQNLEIARLIVSGITKKLSDPRIINFYVDRPHRPKEIDKEFSFCINDLSKYQDLKTRLSKLAEQIINQSPNIYLIISLIREDIRMSKDVFQTQLLGITDLLRFCKNLMLQKDLDINFRKIYKAADNIKMIFEASLPLTIAERFPVDSFDPTKGGGVGIYPDGLSVFFPRRKPGHNEHDEFLNLFMQQYYKNDQYLTDFLKDNLWRQFVIDYYESATNK